MIAPVLPIPDLSADRPYFTIELASPEDDDRLRELLRRSPVPGSISVTFEREPSFFESCKIRGDFFQVAVGRDRRNGEIIGMGTRSIRDGFVNGFPVRLGYLADLRLREEYRGGTLIARGYRFLRKLHEDRRTALYTSVIFADNYSALTTITSGRAGLPQYHDMGLVHSPGINLRGRKPPVEADCEIQRGSWDCLPRIVDCLNRNHARRQFSRVYTSADFKNGFLHFSPEDFYVAVRDGRIVGILGAWDQRPFKQTRVVGYGSKLRWLVPLANVLRPVIRAPRFPEIGEEVPYFYISFIAVDRDDIQVFRALLRRAYNDAIGTPYLYAMLALHERDPFLPALREYSLTPFFGRLFCVTFADGEESYRRLDGRVPYVEAATL